MDSVRADALVTFFATTFNVRLPGVVMKVVNKIFDLFHVDGVVVFSNVGTIPSTLATSISNAVNADVPSYKFDNMVTSFTCA